LLRACPNSVLAGCSTAGEIHGDQVADASLSVAIASFAHVTLRKVLLPIRDPVEAFAVGRDLGRALAAPDLRAVFVLSDGLNVNGSRLTSGLREALPDSVVVTGGLAGDGERFGSTWVIGERAPTDRCVTAVGFYGDRLRVGHGCQAGWSSFGPERSITRAEGNVLYELDNKPALDCTRAISASARAACPRQRCSFRLRYGRRATPAHRSFALSSVSTKRRNR
jgi:hypothetical protein